MNWPWSKHFQVVIVGRESGNRTQLTFLRFRRHSDALEWCLRMNDANNRTVSGGLTYYEVERLPG